MMRLAMAVMCLGLSCARSDIGTRCVMRTDTGAPLTTRPTGDAVTLNAEECDDRLCLLPVGVDLRGTGVIGYCGEACSAEKPCFTGGTCRSANDGGGPTYCFFTEETLASR